MTITPEMIAAWRKLQEFASSSTHNSLNTLSREAAEAIDVLDNSDFMVPIERQEEEEEEDERAVGAFCNCDDPTTPSCIVKGHPLPRLDPAEWGDTTREDAARRQGLHDTA